ncbi:DUF6732 family protein [Jannaschia rubra]|uniref:Uncharacterized protein n=1 Tax=Jannaschia rubra TaxID=282197 RepID=A0A0M6XK79_9RHOB|nr:DUF6732 family protein [Jannaschia rubra]CTQ31556.1 hypothetical protein JAN5088_00314 [Jannaschia rubra]SFF77309.1 hypothetical protein SAMN04488517_101104 [Jannaschia rubra]
MRFLPLFLIASPASAHVGHLDHLGGHDHWGLAIGLGVVAGAAVLGWIKRPRRDEEPEEDAADPEEQEA